MSPRRKKALWQIGIGTGLLVLAGSWYWYGGGKDAEVSSFAECAAAGNPVMESYPRQCRTPDGTAFKEDIGNELDKDDLIRISEPRPNAAIRSPLIVKGMARGNWFFEASFPVKLLDDSGQEIAQGVAQAKGDPATGEVNWMTTEFVPFEARLAFAAPASDSGTLILEKDNPSGLPENANELRVPVRFHSSASDTPPSAKACVITGCSSQICGEEEVVSTCEYRPEYACYKTAQCERQSSGVCGWTETTELRACLREVR